MIELKVDFCSHEAAKWAVEHWHYSRQTPNQKLVKIGVWENGKFIGCVIFGSSANNNLGVPYGLKQVEVCELVRIALDKHVTPVTKIVSLAIKMLTKSNPDLRLIVSYADPERGHIGAIYQAGNWFYTGLTLASDEYIVNGVRMHGRALRSTRSTHRLRNIEADNVLEWVKRVIDPKAKPIEGSSKYRYLYPLDRAMRKQIAPLAKPYPKRDTRGLGERDNAPGSNRETGGASPTSPLPLDQQPRLISG